MPPLSSMVFVSSCLTVVFLAFGLETVRVLQWVHVVLWKSRSSWLCFSWSMFSPVQALAALLPDKIRGEGWGMLVGIIVDGGFYRDDVRVGGSWRHSLGLWEVWVPGIGLLRMLGLLRSWGFSGHEASPLLGIFRDAPFRSALFNVTQHW